MCGALSAPFEVEVAGEGRERPFKVPRWAGGEGSREGRVIGAPGTPAR